VYLWERDDWPKFEWRKEHLAELLARVRHEQGLILGRMGALGFELRAEAVLRTLTQDVVKSSEIEGENLDQEQVRSSIARRLGMDVAGLKPADRDVEGVVEMMLDATRNYEQPLSEERLFGWHASLFPTGWSGLTKIRVGAWRDDANGPMQVVSGAIGREKVHYTAPPAERVSEEMNKFLKWFNQEPKTDPVLKAALAHLWFVSIHPLDDGNGRTARAIADMVLSRSENSAQRFYSMSAQIRVERNDYYDILEASQKASMDITDWMEWFLNCMSRAIAGAKDNLEAVMTKARFWERFATAQFNERQTVMLNKLFDGFYGNLTSSKWAQMMKCSQDTAHRDITDLLEKGALVQNPGGGRSANYSLANIDG
jgi:Fic family protein